MKLEPIPFSCPQCGAPLSNGNDQLVCEYCGHRYRQPKQNDDSLEEEKSWESIILTIPDHSKRPDTSPNFQSLPFSSWLFIALVVMIAGFFLIRIILG